MMQQRELHREAEPVGVAAARGDEGEVLAIEGVAPRQLITIDRDAEQALARRRAQKRPSRHRPAMPEPSRKGRGRS
ncbi:hypothetical protein ABC766_32275 (plasmid) [Methylobacterium fujisawaense]|uniref:hypothetical protein n=1 Tax=Methylobacterium fujisawaense TaxID=107400 RepID=UPI0031F4F6B6